MPWPIILTLILQHKQNLKLECKRLYVLQNKDLEIYKEQKHLLEIKRTDNEDDGMPKELLSEIYVYK